jgi:uncharacterized delta-60 repeat protein
LIAIGSGGVTRLTASGALDAAFAVGQALPGAAGASLAPNGSFVTTDGSGVRRYVSAGSPDPSFGAAGAAVGALGGSGPAAPTVRALAVDSAGRTLVSGSHAEGPLVFVDVARLTNAGAPDPAFAAGGVASIEADVTLGIAQRLDGRIAIWTQSGEVVGLNADGTPDTSLGANARADLGVLGTVLAGCVDSQGRLVVVGLTTRATPPTWFVRRYAL